MKLAQYLVLNMGKLTGDRLDLALVPLVSEIIRLRLKSQGGGDVDGDHFRQTVMRTDPRGNIS